MSGVMEGAAIRQKIIDESMEEAEGSQSRLLDFKEKLQLFLKENLPSAFNKQIGGYHYNDYIISPYLFFLVNEIPHHKAAMCRRALRYDHPTGHGLTDLKKIKHECDLIAGIEYGEDCNGK